MILDTERSFVLEVNFSTEDFGGVLLQPDKPVQLWSGGCCSKLKGKKCHWTALEGVLYTIAIVFTSLQTYYDFVKGLKLGQLY